MSNYSFLGFVIGCGICLFICWIAYRIFLEYKTSPKNNRFIILCIFLFVLLIPIAVNIPLPQRVIDSTSDVTNKIIMCVISGEVSVLSNETSYFNFLWIYLTGVIIMSVFTIKDLVQLYKIHKSASPVIIDGIKVYLHDRFDLSPFSWINRIYVNKEILDIKDEERRALLLHELSHIENYHYLDLILTQIIIISQWFNPAAWKLRKEIKMLHEYEADQNVIASGVDEIEYQYLLLSNLAKVKFNGIVHSLNGSSLRKRVQMMHKKSYSKGFRIRAMIIFIVAIFSGYILHNPIFASSLRGPVKSLKMLPNSDIIQEAFLNAHKQETATGEFIINKEIYSNPDIFPVYGEGGDSQSSLMKDLMKILTYPENAEKNGIQGRVVVSFVVNDKGGMEGFQIRESVDPELDKVALEGIKRLPKKWKPALMDGKPVNYIFYLPVTFRLQEKV